MKALTIIFLAAVAIVAMAQMRHSLSPDEGATPEVDANGFYSDAAGLKVAEQITARGYFCPKAYRNERAAVQSDGTKVYKIGCGSHGPFYALFESRGGIQELRPWPGS